MENMLKWNGFVCAVLSFFLAQESWASPTHDAKSLEYQNRHAAEVLADADNSCEKGPTEKDARVIGSALAKLKDLEANGFSESSENYRNTVNEIVTTTFDRELTPSGKAMFIRHFAQSNAASLTESARKVVDPESPTFRQFRDAQMKFQSAYDTLHIYCGESGYGSGIGFFEARFGGAFEALNAASDDLSAGHRGLTAAIKATMDDPSTTPDTREKLRVYRKRLNEVTARGYACVSDVGAASERKLQGQADTLYLIRDISIAVGISVATAGIGTGAAFTSTGARVAFAVGKGAVSGASSAYSVTLGMGAVSELSKALISGKDISCEFAGRMADKSPELRQAAYKNALLGAAFGGGFGGLIGAGGKVAVWSLRTGKTVAAVATAKGAVGLVGEGKATYADFQKSKALLESAIAETDPIKKIALEREARALLATAREKAIDAGFEVADTALASIAIVKSLHELHRTMNTSEVQLELALSEPPKPKHRTGRLTETNLTSRLHTLSSTRNYSQLPPELTQTEMEREAALDILSGIAKVKSGGGKIDRKDVATEIITREWAAVVQSRSLTPDSAETERVVQESTRAWEAMGKPLITKEIVKKVLDTTIASNQQGGGT